MKRLASLTAVKLRILLSFSLALIIIAMVAFFYIAQDQLRETAVNVSHSVADAEASQNNVQILEKIKKELTEKRDVVEKAQNIVAESQSYQYQDQIIADLNSYANKAGLTIASINFGTSTATPTPTSGTNATPTLPAPTGVKSSQATIAIKNPANYEGLLRFLTSIEQNLTKMQVSRVGLSKSDNRNEVTSETLTIQVYIR